MTTEIWNTLLSIGGEGILIEVKGQDAEKQWKFRRVVTDLETGDRSFSNAETDALALIESYAWLSLYPMYIDEALVNQVKRKILTHSYRNDSAFSAWTEKCFPERDKNQVKLANWLLTSKSTIVLTGAGMSTESNLPDFRSKEGWWRSIDPITVAAPEALDNNYELFTDFYTARLEALEGTAPHEGHQVIADWEERGFVDAVATQNVDGLHTAAGSKNVYELHGSLKNIYCHNCGAKAAPSDFKAKRKCGVCGGKLRPGVILFGEMLPQEAWNTALSRIKSASLIIVIGTSLEVYPANQLPLLASGRTVYLNAEVSSSGQDFDLVLEGKAKTIITEVQRIMHEAEGLV